MYSQLWTNGPKECVEFPDYTYEEHFGGLTTSFPPREACLDYIKGYAKKHKVNHDWIRLNTTVTKVDYNPEIKKFKVQSSHLNGDVNTELYDNVIVAIGHFSTPNMPDLNGIDKFKGLVMHSHDFRDARYFSGQRVVVVGASLSAEDIGCQLHKFGAQKVIVAHRKKDMHGNWTKMGNNWQIQEKPVFKDIEENTVIFGDDS